MSSGPKRAEELFHAALEMPKDERDAFLEQACGDDSRLRSEVASLLEHHESAGGFMGTPAVEEAFGPVGAGTGLSPGGRFGSYQLLELLGEGGMGVVFLARQESPPRDVALKVLRPGVATPAMLRRFEFESRVLGRLKHPGIAQIFEAGTADAGSGPQPYFAMEYIEGRPLLEHARERELDTRERLELLAGICDAVHHAHQNGVIHRDLKPGNLLVDRSGQPKVLDFGVARTTDADVRSTTLLTGAGEIVGTLPYMSPEQAAGDAEHLDTRSDVYSLGIVAYELLTDRLPYDVSRKLIHEAVRVICEDDPKPLSAANRILRGDVETIVSKALEKERERRYPSASDLGADIRRYLDDVPISAHPVSTLYQLGKFARRNRVLVWSAATLIVVLAAGALTTGWQALRAGRQRDRAIDAESKMELALQAATAALHTAEEQRTLADERREEAERQAQIAQAVNDFLNDDMIAAVSPERTANPDVSMRTVLDNAAQRIEGRFREAPLVEASIRRTIGSTYVTLGLLDAARPQLEAALQIQERELGGDDPETLETGAWVGRLLLGEGRLDEAIEAFVRTLEFRRQALGAEHPRTLSSMGNLSLAYLRVGRLPEAQELLLEDLETSRRVLPEDDPHTIISTSILGDLYRMQERLAEAEPLLVAALEGMTRELGEEHPHTLACEHSLAQLRWGQGRLQEAHQLLERCLEKCRRVLGDENKHTLITMSTQGKVLSKMGRAREASVLLSDALAGQRRFSGPTHVDTLSTASSLADVHSRLGRPAEAEELYLEVLEALPDVLGAEHPNVLTSMGKLSALYIKVGRLEDAEPLQLETLAIQRRVLGPDHRQTLTSVHNLASLYLKLERLVESERLYAEVVEGFRKIYPPGHPSLGIALGSRGRCLIELERYEAAQEALLEAHTILDRAMGPSHERTVMVARSLAALYEAWSKPEAAREWQEKLEDVGGGR